jgi:hypothetical protein
MNDLSQFDTNKVRGRKMTLLRPDNGEPLMDRRVENGEEKEFPVTITLLSQDSDEFKSTTRKISNQRLQKQIKRGIKKVAFSAEDIEADNLDLLSACTVGWEGIGLDGAPLEFNRENARLLYRRCAWVREQVDEFIADRVNFLGNS